MHSSSVVLFEEGGGEKEKEEVKEREKEKEKGKEREKVKVKREMEERVIYAAATDRCRAAQPVRQRERQRRE